jgi:hypothetical protein
LINFTFQDSKYKSHKLPVYGIKAWCGCETQTSLCPMQLVLIQVSSCRCAPTQITASGESALLHRIDSHRLDRFLAMINARSRTVFGPPFLYLSAFTSVRKTELLSKLVKAVPLLEVPFSNLSRSSNCPEAFINFCLLCPEKYGEGT